MIATIAIVILWHNELPRRVSHSLRGRLRNHHISMESLNLMSKMNNIDSNLNGTDFEGFPDECLPRSLREFARGVARSIGCPVEFVILPMLSALASAIGQSRIVEIYPGWKEPAILWTCVVAKSGSGKTPALKQVLGPLHAIQIEALKSYQLECESLVEATKAKNRGKPKRDHEEPDLPPRPRYIVDDCTMESLAPILHDNPDGVLLGTDELATWLDGFNQYKGKGNDRSRWLSIHEGEPIIVDRKGADVPIVVPCGMVSVTGGIQPGVLRSSITQKDHESGLTARIIFVMPPFKPLKAMIAPAPAPEVLKDILRQLIANRGATRTITLSEGAQHRHVSFRNRCNARIGEADEFLASAIAKLPGRVSRLALILHCVEHDEQDEISVATMEKAIAIAEWSEREVTRVYRNLGISDSPQIELMDFVRLNKNVSPRDLQLKFRRRYPRAEDAEKALMQLANQGFVERITVDNGRPGPKSTVFRWIET